MNIPVDHDDFDPESASIEELREHIARKRSAIDANLGELERRVQPDYIAEHVVERGRELLTGQSGSIAREFGHIARENPLGTALTCFGLALLAKGYLEGNSSSSSESYHLQANRTTARAFDDPDFETDSGMQTDQSAIRRDLKNEQHYVPSYSGTDINSRNNDSDIKDTMLKGAALAAGIGVAVGGYVAYTRYNSDSGNSRRDSGASLARSDVDAEYEPIVARRGPEPVLPQRDHEPGTTAREPEPVITRRGSEPVI